MQKPMNPSEEKKHMKQISIPLGSPAIAPGARSWLRDLFRNQRNPDIPQQSRPCKLLSWSSVYPRGGRVVSIALAKHHRTPRSAGTAPRPHGFDLVGARFAFGRARPAWRRWKGSD